MTIIVNAVWKRDTDLELLHGSSASHGGMKTLTVRTKGSAEVIEDKEFRKQCVKVLKPNYMTCFRN